MGAPLANGADVRLPRALTFSGAAIGDALLGRFKQAVAQHVAALPAGSYASLAEALVALGLLSQHAEATPLLESLLAWRLGALRCVEPARARQLAELSPPLTMRLRTQ